MTALPEDGPLPLPEPRSPAETDVHVAWHHTDVPADDHAAYHARTSPTRIGHVHVPERTAKAGPISASASSRRT